MFSFRKKPQAAIAPAAAANRFSAADKMYGDINSEARVQRKNAMLFAAGCLIVAAIEAYGQSAASSRPALVPVIIRVDQHGNAMNIGTPPRLDQDPTTTALVVQYQLRQFVQSVRSVTYDPGFQKKLMTDYVMPFLPASSEATTLVNDFYKKNDPFKFATGGNTIDAQVRSVIPQTNTTYAIDWLEITKTANGVVSNTTEWNGYATVDLGVLSTDPDIAKLNPIGMYVRTLTWQNVAVKTAAPPTP